MNADLKNNLSRADHWVRVLYVVVFLVLAKIAGFLILVVAIAQALALIITGQFNRHLLKFGSSLTKYLTAVYSFVVGQNEHKPFPFDDWPEPDAAEPIDLEPDVAAKDDGLEGDSLVEAESQGEVKPAHKTPHIPEGKEGERSGTDEFSESDKVAPNAEISVSVDAPVIIEESDTDSDNLSPPKDRPDIDEPDNAKPLSGESNLDGVNYSESRTPEKPQKPQ